MFLPVGICDGSTGVAAAVAWSQMVVNYSSMLIAEEGMWTMPTQVDNKARSYAWEVCSGSWALVSCSWAQCSKIGGAKYTSKCQLEWSSEGLETEEEQLFLLECAKAARARLCKA